jgi:hypothetical protein
LLSILPFLFLALTGSQQQSPEPFDPNRQSWELPLLGARLESIPDGTERRDWFGGPEWGRGGDSLSDGDEHALRARVRHDEDFVHDEIRFRLDAQGASVQVTHSSDVLIGPLQDVGGVICLVTDGQDTTLEFEIYAVYGGYLVKPFAGVVSLHGKGRELALDRSKQLATPDQSPFDRLVRITAREDGSESHGYVDELGRRQGGWSLKQRDGRRLQVGWRDGVPHGTVLGWDEAGLLRDLRHYEFGLETGERMDWNEEGGLRSIDSRVRGQQDGRRVVFDPTGVKQIELVTRAPGPSTYLSRFEALHTRPRR